MTSPTTPVPLPSPSADDGGPAFPRPVTITPDGDAVHSHYAGMSLRDYFAAKIIGGYCPNVTVSNGAIDLIAYNAYRMADAMLAARSRHHG